MSPRLAKLLWLSFFLLMAWGAVLCFLSGCVPHVFANGDKVEYHDVTEGDMAPAEKDK